MHMEGQMLSYVPQEGLLRKAQSSADPEGYSAQERVNRGAQHRKELTETHLPFRGHCRKYTDGIFTVSPVITAFLPTPGIWNMF